MRLRYSFADTFTSCLDEMDKMSDQTRSILHEAMEQQSISIAKAGIICTLNARTSILASANPVESRYNPRLSVVDNIQLPPTLLSRFDLIYLVLDHPSKPTDTRLAKHIVRLYCKNPPQQEALIEAPLLREYISFARATVFPRLSEAASIELVEAYVAMRRLGGNKKTITATPRQLESLVRLSEALARMRLSETVERADVVEATRLMRVALQQAAIDPVTGTLDMDLITTGRSATSRARMADLTRAVRGMLEEQEVGSMSFDDIMQRMRLQSDIEIPPPDLKAALRELEQEEVIVRQGAQEGRNPIFFLKGLQ
jgi:DNA replication licensing factor MCM4